MLSARSIYDEIVSSDEAFRLVMSVASVGEAQGGWENNEIAARTEDAELSEKIQRHGDDEKKHGRLFEALIRKRGLVPIDVPFELNYTARLERDGIGVSHERLRHESPLSDEEIIKYLVHSRVTEQRAGEEIAQQNEIFRDNPELCRAVAMVADDEINHLSYTHEELARFVERGYGDLIRRMLKQYAMAEIRTYRDVSLGVMRRLGTLLGWSSLKRSALALGIHSIYWVERLFTWRRMTSILPPERPDAMAPQQRHISPASGTP